MNTPVTLPADKFDTNLTFVKPDSAPTRVALDKLAVLPGFNTRVRDQDYHERVTGICESIVDNGFFEDKPFAVTMLPNDDTVYVYDGEHRLDAVRQAVLDGAEFPDGLPVAWAKDGATVRDLTIHLAHGNAGERLNMVELAVVVRRMQGLGMDKAEIAKALGRTTRHVDNLFVLADANQAVKKAVASGKIAGAEAVKLVRKHGAKDAATEITARIKRAEERGHEKASPKAYAPAGPKMKTIAVEQSMPEGEVMGTVLKSLAGKIRQHVQIGEGDKLGETGMIRVKIEVIDREAEAAKAEAEAAKIAAAEKREAEKAEAAAKKAAEKAEAAAKREAEKALLAETVKAPAKAKTVSKPKKPAQADSGKKGGKAPPKPKKAASEPQADAQTPPEADDGMGGL